MRGRVAIDRAETRWTFVPDGPWSRGEYRIVAHSALEDLAGNNLDHPFELPVDGENGAAPSGDRRVIAGFRMP